jgi:hypothetical protein
MGDCMAGHLTSDQRIPETVALNLTFKAVGQIIEMGSRRTGVRRDAAKSQKVMEAAVGGPGYANSESLAVRL